MPSIPGMSELTGDEWSATMVGHQWPGASALITLSDAAASRQSAAEAFHGYADGLGSVTGALRDQQGEAAESIRAAFRDGEDHARAVAERNAAKSAALTRAHHTVSALRSALWEIAERGRGQIRMIIDGDDPAPVKTARIAEVVAAARTEADGRAGLCAHEVYGSIQAVLDACGASLSAREFSGG